MLKKLKKAFTLPFQFMADGLKLFYLLVEKFLDTLLAWLRKMAGIRRPALSLTYVGYGHKNKTRVLGRIVEGFKQNRFSERSYRLIHFYRVVKLFFTKKFPEAKIKVFKGEQEYHLTTNKEGFFSEVLHHPENNSAAPFHCTTLDVGDPSVPILSDSHEMETLFSTPKTDYLVVSDIDDTIIKSRATSLTRLVFNTLFFPVDQRQNFPEAAQVYQKLHKGLSGDRNNLFFYVSSSSWNLYPVLRGYLEFNAFPHGSILLQDLASEREKPARAKHQHKLERICEIVEVLPDYPLLLIGDAGQRDPWIYLEVRKRLKERVPLILIRRSWWVEQAVTNEEVLSEAQALGVRMVYFDHLQEVQGEIEAFMKSADRGEA